MSYFITVPEAMQEFNGIREAQLLEIIKQGWAAPHDEQGYRLTAETFHARVRQQTESEVHSLQEQLATSLHRNLGWGGESSHNRQMRLAYRERIEEAREDTPSAVLHSMSFIREELEKAIQEHYPDVFQASQKRGQSSFQQAGNDPLQNIQAWEVILPELSGAELTAAKLAIEKWSGKPHVEAFDAVRPGEKVQDPKNYVSKKKKTAASIVERYNKQGHNLIMPRWEGK